MCASQPQSLGQLIRRHRLAAGLSQEALSNASGVSVRTISDLERGQRPSAHLETVRLLASALSLSDLDLRNLLEASHPELREEEAISLPRDLPRLDSPWRQSLPVPPTPLVGREPAVAAILTLLEKAPGKVITLTGPGGVGKTRLAIEVASLFAPSLIDGAAFVPLASVFNPAQVLAAIAQALGMPLRSATLPERLTSFLENRRLLLLLDNFEHVIDAAPLVAQLNAGCPGVTILVTSRVRLRLSAELEYPVPPLTMPESGGSLEQLRLSGAMQLFAERAKAVDPDFSLTEANANAVSDICRRLDGLPLAIELATSRLKVLPVSSLLARLDQRLPLLTGGSRDMPPRQQSMRQTIAWSYGLLSPVEQRLFPWLSVFVDGFSLEAAGAAGEAIGADALLTLEIVSALVESGLLRRTSSFGAEARFQMLETIREYGLEQLAEMGETGAAQMVHATYFLAFSSQDAPMPDEPMEDSWIGRLHGEHSNLVAAFEHLCQPETSELCMQFAAAFGPYCTHGLPGEEGLSRLCHALELAPPHPALLRAQVLFWAALLAHESGYAGKSSDLGREGLTVAQALGDRTMEAAAIFILAINEELQEHWDTAPELLQRALAMWKDLDNAYMQAWTLMILGGLAYAQGDLSLARAQEEEAEQLYKETAGALPQAGTQWYLGFIALADGRTTDAASHYERSLRLWLTTEHRSHWFKPLVHLADVAAKCGCCVHAARFLGAADRMLRDTGTRLFPFDVPAHDRAERASRAALGDEAYAAAYAAGHGSTPDDWLVEAKAIVGAAGP